MASLVTLSVVAVAVVVAAARVTDSVQKFQRLPTLVAKGAVLCQRSCGSFAEFAKAWEIGWRLVQIAPDEMSLCQPEAASESQGANTLCCRYVGLGTRDRARSPVTNDNLKVSE